MSCLASSNGVHRVVRVATLRKRNRRRVPVRIIRCSVDKVVVKTNKAPLPLASYSQAVKSNKLVFLSQMGIVPGSSSFISDNPAEQTKQAMENIRSILEAAGSSMDHVIKVTIMMSDIQHFKQINEVYASFFGEDPPARAAFAAAGLPVDGHVEIDVIALEDKD
eukprot:g6102.t1